MNSVEIALRISTIPSRGEWFAQSRHFDQNIKPNGGIWVVSPRGRKEIRDIHVIAAAKNAGLVDVKVCRFSETHTALKLVIPRDKR